MGEDILRRSAAATSALQPRAMRGLAQSSPRIGGLLVLWTIGLALFPIVFAPNFYQTSLPALGLRPCNVPIGAALHLSPPYGVLLFLLGVALDIGQVCVWPTLVWSYFARSSSTRRLTITFLGLGLAHGLLPIMVSGGSIKGHETACFEVLAMGLGLPYVLLSERVRRTFILRPISELTLRGAIGSFLVLSVVLGGFIARSYLTFDPAAFARSSALKSTTGKNPQREFQTEVSSTNAGPVALTTNASAKVDGSRRASPQEPNGRDSFAAPSRLKAAAAHLNQDVDHPWKTPVR